MTTGGADARSGTGVVAISHDDRAAFDQALYKARVAAYPPGEWVGQESFMRASDIAWLAERAEVGPGASVLDACCGAGGAGVLITRQFGCSYLGVDASASAIRLARARAGDLRCRFEVAQIPPLPPGPFDVVLLLETMLAFSDKASLLRHVAAALAPGGRFAFTVEEGEPLTERERAGIPDPGTVWLTPLRELQSLLHAAGMTIRLQVDFSQDHQVMAQRLHDAFSAGAAEIGRRLGVGTVESLLSAHRQWSDWLRNGRVRKLAMVAERAAARSDGV